MEENCKYCSRCKTNKPISEFGIKKTSKDGLQLWCKVCTREYYNQWRVANEDKSKPTEIKSFNNFYTSIHGRAVHMINNARRRAASRGLEFDLDEDWIEERLLKAVCEVTGLPLNIATNGGKGHIKNSFSPSIDRIIQKGPYTKENCRITCWIYNRARGAFPPHDFDLMVEAINQPKLPVTEGS